MSPDSNTGARVTPNDTLTPVPPPVRQPAPPRPPAPGKVTYTCPMHPEVRQDHAGPSPKCGMALEPVTPPAGGTGAGVGTDLCPCLVCSGDTTFPCSSNAECGALAGSCAGAPNGGGVTCSADPDCTSANIGPCNNLSLCNKKQSQGCATNTDCLNHNVGPCSLQTCTSAGAGITPQPNFCIDDICTDQGGGEGECTAGPSFKYCDGLVKADGQGINSCTDDAGWSANSRRRVA